MTASGSATDTTTLVTSLTSQYPSGLLGLPDKAIRLSWAVETSTNGTTQLGYQIQTSPSSNFAVVTSDTQLVRSSQQLGVALAEPVLTSREVRYYRVRIQTEQGLSPWSKPLAVEAGLLTQGDLTAKFISDDSAKESPSPLLRKEIKLSGKPIKARLYASAAGLYEFYINGVAVTDSYLNPGWTAYQDRILLETHDVTHLLGTGVNALGGILSDGWFRGRMGFRDESENYGSEMALYAQLEVEYQDGSKQAFTTGPDWKVSTGEIRFSSIYDGSTIDGTKAQPGWMLPGFDDAGWSQAQLVNLSITVLEPRITNPVRKVGEFNMTVEAQSDLTLLRGPQNISGWVRLVVDGKKGQTVVVRHAEVLEPGDVLHTKALRSAKATDRYVLGHDGRNVLEPRFTFHGFQYASVATEATVVSATAIAVSSDNARRGHFDSSDVRLNRLHENVVWSQLDNFVSIPTDCPQRDERLGWTGDAQAFAGTASTLFNTSSFFKSWLIDVALDQYETGDVGAIVPDIFKRHPELIIGDWVLEGRAGWADAATIVPMAVYESFGDLEVLETQLNSMRKWAQALINRRGSEKFLPTQFQFGDWCDPDAPGDRPWDAKVSADFVANSFFAKTLDLMVQAEELVGDKAKADNYRKLSAELKHNLWTDLGPDAIKTTAGCSFALEFDIVPPAQKQQLADSLAAMTAADKGKIATGFLATPIILHALSKNGHIEQAYQMLMRRGFRSWLYAVDKGATTIWERWDAIREDGSIHKGEMDTNPEGQDDASMISFNHYAYGAVIDWVYRNVAGIAPVLSEPGYRRTVVAPKPAIGFSFSSASIASGFGDIASKWQVSDSSLFVLELKVPFGVTAELDLPVSADSIISCNGIAISNGAEIKHGKYVVTVTNPAITSYVAS